MDLPVMPPVAPMLASLVRDLPAGRVRYEPKWDGFRAIVFRDGDEVEIGSRSERSLTRYFPELIDPLRTMLPERCVVDGEIVIVTALGLDFDLLSQRIHPAASRIATLAQRTPAAFVAFDVLALDDRDLRSEPFAVRSVALDRALAHARSPVVRTPWTDDLAEARDWFERFEGAGFDGVLAKSLDAPYCEGERRMQKVKHERTADVVVAGYRMHRDGAGVGSLLLGLFDERATLHSVGVASGMAARLRVDLLGDVAPLRIDAAERAAHPWLASDERATAAEGARRPGAPNRWNAGAGTDWIPLRPERVAEVRYGHLHAPPGRGPGRFRHNAQFVRWRPDRPPASCTYAQLDAMPPIDLLTPFAG